MDISSVASKSITSAPGGGTRVIGQTAPASSGSVAPKTASAGTGVAAQVSPSERVAQAVKQVNDDFIQKGQNLYASYERDKATGINVVKVMDKNTREVVKQFPSEEIITIAKEIDRYQEGKGRLIYVSA